MYRKIRAVILAGIFLVAVFLGGCASEQAAGPAVTQTPVKSKSPSIFRVNLLSRPLTIDPAQAATESELILVRALYSTLVEYKEGEISPALAKSWYYSEDGKQLFIQLREGLKFSNGRPLTSADVEFSLERIQDPALASPYASLVTSEIGGRETVAGAVAVTGTNSLVISFPVPRKDFIELLAHPCFSIVSRDSMLKNNHGLGSDLSSVTSVAASGPLSIVEWVDNQNIALEPNKRYFTEAPDLDRVEMVVDSNLATTMYDYGTEYLDVIFLRDPRVDRILTEYPDLGDQLQAGPSAMVYFLTLNPQSKFFKDPQIRQAVLGAADVSGLVESSEMFISAGYPLRKLPRGGNYSGDPKDLLFKAGYIGEVKLPELVLSYPPGKISSFIAEHLKQELTNTIGAKVILKETPPQRQWFYDSSASLSLVCWTIPYPAKSAFFPYFFAGSGNPFTFGQPGGEAAKLHFNEIGTIEKAAQRDYYYNLISDAVSQELLFTGLVEVKNVYAVRNTKELDNRLIRILGLSEQGNKLSE